MSKYLLALDTDEYNVLCDLATAQGTYFPTYNSLNLSSGFYYVFDSQDAEQVEKIFLMASKENPQEPK